MKTTTLIIGLLIMTTALATLAPTVDARQVCTYNTGEPCERHLVCVWNRLSWEWDCYGYIGPCNFRCW